MALFNFGFSGVLLIVIINLVATLIALKFSAKHAYKIDATYSQALIQLIVIFVIQIIVSAVLYFLLY